MTVYAYARVGYHRSLDLLRRNGWKGHGPVPWEHEPNRGFLRCLALLALAARAIGETDEWERCSDVPARLQPGGVRRAAGLTPRLDATPLSGAQPPSSDRTRVRAERHDQRGQARAAVGVDQQVVEQPEELLLVGLDLVGRRRRRGRARAPAWARRRPAR